MKKIALASLLLLSVTAYADWQQAPTTDKNVTVYIDPDTITIADDGGVQMWAKGLMKTPSQANNFAFDELTVLWHVDCDNLRYKYDESVYALQGKEVWRESLDSNDPSYYKRALPNTGIMEMVNHICQISP